MEPRRLLSAASVPNVLGLYAGDLSVIGNGSDTLTITLIMQRQRTIAGSFDEGSSPVAKFQGSFNANGVLHFTYQGSGFSGRGTGSFDPTETIIDATFRTRQRGHLLGGTFEVQLRERGRPCPPFPNSAGRSTLGRASSPTAPTRST